MASETRFVGQDNRGSRARYDFGPTVKTLDPRELARLRLLLEERPDLQDDPNVGGAYPKMLFHTSYYEWQQKWKTELDELEKPKHAAMMVRATKKVFSEDEELEYVADGWRESPADHLTADQDPRIPRGMEARKAAKDKKLSAEQEIFQLRRRLAELTGVVEEKPVTAAPVKRALPKRGPAVAPPPPASTHVAGPKHPTSREVKKPTTKVIVPQSGVIAHP
jgi:hypothetical protein